jgi:glycosyltransferase involved in cell wall biosynthesis
MIKSGPAKIIIGLPAYNEEKYLGSIILRVKQYADEVIVVDDGSSDRTTAVAELAGAMVIRHESNRGVGVAIRAILTRARERDADILVTLDADYQHNPDEIPSLIEAVRDGNDVVIGSRYMQRHMIPRYRRIGQKILGGLTNFVSGESLTDTESGFRAYSRRAIEKLELKEPGFAVCSEIIKEAAAKKLTLKEVPTSVSYTGDGSTLHPVSHGAGVLRRLLAMISEERPLFFFGLFGSILVIAGVVMGILVARAMYVDQVLQTGTALVSVLLITVGVLTLFTGIILSVLIRRFNDRL